MESQEKTVKPFNLSDILHACIRKWYWIALSAGLCVAYVVYGHLKEVPMAQVEGQILISTDTGSSLDSFSDIASLTGMSKSFGSARTVHEERVILSSHSLMLDVARQVGFNIQYKINRKLKKIPVYGKIPVVMQYDPAINDTLSRLLTFDINVDANGTADIKARTKKEIARAENVRFPATVTTPYGEFTFLATAYCLPGRKLSETITLTSYDGAANALSKLVNVGLSSKKADVISLTYATNDPVFGKQLIDSVMDSYKELTINQQREYLQYSLDFINARIATLATELNIAELNIEDFMSRRDLVNPTAQASLFLSQNTAQEQELIRAENDHELLRLAIEFLSAETNNSSLLPIMPSIASLTPLIEGYNDLILQRITIEPSARGDNAALKAMNIRIEAVKENLMTALQKHYEMAQVQIEELRKQWAESKSKMETLPGIEREYVDIKRQQSLQEQLYLFLLNQREQTSIKIASAQPMGIIIDKAFVNTGAASASPKLKLLVALIFGCCIPAGVIVLRWKINGRVNTLDQAAGASGCPAVACLPIAGRPEGLYVAAEPQSLQAERYRLMRANLLSTPRLARKGGTIAVTTTCESASEGAAIAVNLALAISATGRRTAIVDADLYHSAVAPLLGIKAAPMVNALTEGGPAIAKRVDTLNGRTVNIDAMTSQADESLAADITARPDFADAIARLRLDYEYVIVVLPSALHFAALESGAAVADAVVAAVDIGSTRLDTAARLDKLADHDHDIYIAIISK